MDAVSRLGAVRPRRDGALAAAIIAVLGAQGFSAATAYSSRSAVAGSVELKGTYVLSGAVSKHGTFADPELVRSSCAQIAKEGTGAAFVGGPNRFSVPGPLQGAGEAESTFFTAGVTYEHPGTFTKEQLKKAGGTDLMVGKNSYNAVATAASASMTVKANGSGTFTFANAPPVGKGPSLSGKVSWTCTA
jgi:hypothetical protein